MALKKRWVSIKNLYEYFVGALIKDGKKSKAKKIVNFVLNAAVWKEKKPALRLLLLFFANLHTNIEARTTKYWKYSNIIPVFIPIKRRFFLAMKWLLLSIKEDKSNISIKKKILWEFLRVIKKDFSCKTLTKRRLNVSLAIKNRSNFHYRWN